MDIIGARLFTVCYNGEKYPSTIDSRYISDKSFEMIKSRKLIGKLPIKNVRGLSYDGENFWSIDINNKQLQRFNAKQ